MPNRLITSLSCLPLLLLLLAACENYDFKVNERVVYSPAPLFSDFDAPDEALRGCLEQAIADAGVRAAGQLSSLNCSHAGIEDLSGMGSFPAVVMLKLSSNNIRNLVELGAITQLQELHLDNNRVVDPVPLYELPALRYLDLSGNPQLQCPANAAFLRVETIILPEHCR